MIKGKQGRFRENLLGKRVDYSARSVIVVGPELDLHQCGLPKKIALELYQPFIIRKLKERNLADTIKSAKRMLERQDEQVWDILEEVIHQHPVLLNRAPTLHRMGIQAFEPVLVEGNAIKIHPLVCKGFNADFDGDQMAVHLPLSIEAQVEATTLMMSTNNIFSPAHGGPIISPSQDIVLGIYWLSLCHDPEEVEHPPSFKDIHEAMMAYDVGKVGLHNTIRVRLPEGATVLTKKGRRQIESVSNGRDAVETTVGRLILNDILPEAMPFYNFLLDDGGVNQVISDSHRLLGRKATISVLDGIKELGFRHSTLAGLSFAATDLRIPETKEKLIANTQKEVDRIEKQRRSGVITEGERYNQIIDRWTHVREDVAEQMMQQLAEDYRDKDGRPTAADKGALYLNPIYLMADSGARGSKDQIRQLAGMRGLMQKPSGKIIETPITSNFREGLSVLEYFSSTHGARKGLADTALKTADSGYLTRKLADVAQNLIVTEIDCGTLNGIRKSTIYEGQDIKVPLSASIVGRTARDTILNPITNEPIVKENETITAERARRIEELGLTDTIRVRSPLTCESPLGICARCYGVDLSSGRLVEEGTAVGIIAAQSIGEPGTQLTMRTFHIGGVHAGSVAISELVAGREGEVEYRDLSEVAVDDREGKRTVVLKRNGDIAILDPKGRELEAYRVPYGARLLVKNGQKVKRGQKLATWDPFRVPILAEAAGTVRYQDIVEGETMRLEKEARAEKPAKVIIEHKGDLHPQIVIEDKEGKIIELHYLPARAYVDVEEGDKVVPGSLLARQARELTRQSDITGGLPRVTEIFEARKPKDPSVMAEITGGVDIRSDKRRGKMTIVVRNEQTGMEKEHHVPHGKRLLVHAGDTVQAGAPLVAGPLVPHDILRIKGEEALQEYLLSEIQNVYRSQNVRINDKHVEIILSQMLRKVKVEQVGDSDFLPGDVVDKFQFRRANEVLARSIRVADPGDTELKEAQILPRAELSEINAEVEEAGGEPAKGKRPKQASAKTLLLGITKASLQSDSFLAAASFQETTKVLTEAALAGKTDPLLGLKENIILGHLVPAGTAFKPHLEMVPKHLGEPLPIALGPEEGEEAEEAEAPEKAEAVAQESAD
jgi:DNA-directed RNA polymerase subunit beta'